MGRWARSRQLAAASWQVVKQDKELMLLPLISGIASILIGASFLVPLILTGRHADAFGGTTFRMGPLQYVLMFAMYVVLAYVTIFFRTALLSAADERMRGGNPTFGSALSGAGERAGAILPWAIVSATVSIILRSLEERAGIVGRIVISIVGMAWAVVTFLVLPIIVFEGVGVGTAVKRSTEMLKRTWGENLIVNGGIGLISFLLMIPAIAVIVVGAATGTAPGVAVGIIVGGAWMIAVVCWSSAMQGVFQVALYRYATTGTAPGPFAHIDMQSAFRQRGSRRGFGFGGGGFGGGGFGGGTRTPGWGGQPGQPPQPWGPRPGAGATPPPPPPPPAPGQRPPIGSLPPGWDPPPPASPWPDPPQT